VANPDRLPSIANTKSKIFSEMWLVYDQDQVTVLAEDNDPGIPWPFVGSVDPGRPPHLMRHNGSSESRE